MHTGRAPGIHSRPIVSPHRCLLRRKMKYTTPRPTTELNRVSAASLWFVNCFSTPAHSPTANKAVSPTAVIAEVMPAAETAKAHCLQSRRGGAEHGRGFEMMRTPNPAKRPMQRSSFSGLSLPQFVHVNITRAAANNIIVTKSLAKRRSQKTRWTGWRGGTWGVALEGRWELLWLCRSGVFVLSRNPAGARRQGERAADVPACGAGVGVRNSACAELGLCPNPVNEDLQSLLPGHKNEGHFAFQGGEVNGSRGICAEAAVWA